MTTTDPSGTAGLDEQCLVHHFIRTHGRRPRPEELAALQRVPVATLARGTSARHESASLAGVVRRELARMLSRL